jgi:hypothetical protein
MRREKLIIASPKSIQAVATAVHGERQGAAVCATKMPMDASSCRTDDGGGG